MSEGMTYKEAIVYLNLCAEEAKSKDWGSGIKFAIEFIEDAIPKNCDTCKHKDDGMDSEHCDGCCGNHNGFELQESEEISREEIVALLARESEEMTRDQARDTLRNAAWLGTDEEREQIEKAVELLCGESCGDAISREAVKELYYKDGYIDFHKICELPSVIPQPKTGHWIIISPTDMYCSECNEIEHLDTSRKFCAYCGTRMVEPQENEE